MAEEIKHAQEAVYEKETERLSYENQAVGEEFEKLMKDYIEEDKYQQYLVDGAVLRCNKATTDDFPFDGGTVILENKDEEVCNIILNVHENPMDVNGLTYATAADTIKNINIVPPRCNCRLAAERNAERKKIREDSDRNKNGVCMHLMNLNGKWDNFEVNGTAYLKKVNAVISLSLAKDGGIEEGPGDPQGEEEGITMTSVLFCKHGGLIMPVTSGQTVVQTSRNVVKLELSINPTALSNTSIEPANVLCNSSHTQAKIQKLCNNNIIYFDEDGYQRVKNTGLESEPYLVAIGEYYSSAAVSNGVGDYQGYGAIFKVAFTSGKEIYVTMGDAKDPKHTKVAMEKEGGNFYAGDGNSANALEFICNFLNRNTEYYSENMSGSKGSDANRGKAYTITEGATISEIELVIDKEIEWEEYFELND